MTIETPSASLMRALLCACAFAAPAAADAPAYNANGELLRPADYRDWVYVTTGIDMFYGPAAEAAPAANESARPSVFTNVFVTRPAYEEFMRSGTWPDKTMFILEVRRAEKAASIDNGGRAQGARAHDRIRREGRAALRRERRQQRLGLLRLRQPERPARFLGGAADDRVVLLVSRLEHGCRQHVRAVLSDLVRGRASASAPSRRPTTRPTSSDASRELTARVVCPLWPRHTHVGVQLQ